MVTIRKERPGDEAGIRSVHKAAFASPLEARIVDALRAACGEIVSLVAADDDRDAIVGHILFSPVQVAGGTGPVEGMGLGPMSVLPERQRQGIGSRLVDSGLTVLRPCPFVVVLGHPGFYPRFGFRRASLHGLRPAWTGIPDDAFMVWMQDERAIAGVSGVVRYRDEFDISAD